MRREICLLPGRMIDQIAAGEVIENPASVVKELIENSIDAGAKTIAITIGAGGKQKILIEDDGIGMDEKNLKMSLVRHATSKIADYDDLFSFSSFGFRGEALASIASISKLTIYSKTSDQEHGYKVFCEGGKIIEEQMAARNRGTTVLVESLFYNVPARKKFQKSILSCTSGIIKTIHLISLAYPDVKMTFASEEKNLCFNQTDLKKRVEKILGKDFVKKSCCFEHKEGSLLVKGFLGDPSFVRYNRKGGYLFINNRPVFCPMIFKAIKDGYATHIPEKCFPAFVVFLQVPPKWIDVNVHPQKKEVRLLEEKMLYSFMRDVVIDNLGKTHEIPKINKDFSFSVPEKPYDPYVEEPAASFNMEQKSFSIKEDLPFEAIKIVGQYLLIEQQYLSLEMQSDVSIVIIDLQAVLAKSLFLGSKKKIDSMQRLTIPYTFDICKDEVEKVRQNSGFIEKMGLEFRILGEKTIAIDAMLSFLKQQEIPEIFSNFSKGTNIAQDKKVARLCSLIAKRKKVFSSEEAKHLFFELHSMKNPLYCPLGKKVFTELNIEVIERLFQHRSLNDRLSKTI